MNVPSENHKVSLVVNSITQKIQQKKRIQLHKRRIWSVWRWFLEKWYDMYVNCGWQRWMSSCSYFRAWNWNGREGTHTHTYPIERSSNLAIVILVESPSVPSTWSHVQFHQLPNFLIFQREHWIRRNAFFIYGRKSDNGTKIIPFFLVTYV